MVDAVSQEIQRWILEGTVDPGKPLPSERQLARRFATSRTSIREALSALSACGLVSIEHGRGVFVREREVPTEIARPARWGFDAGLSLRDAYQLRLLIEPYAVGTMTPNLSPKTADFLAACVDRLDQAYASSDYVEAARFDFEFHWTFVEASGNQTFCQLISQCASILPPNSGLGGKAVIEHRRILDRMLSGDAEGAASRMQDHIVLSAQRARITLQPFNFQV